MLFLDQTDGGNRLLKIAAAHGQLSIVELLLTQPGINLIGIKGIAEKNKHHLIAQKIEEWIKNKNTTVFPGQLIHIIHSNSLTDLIQALEKIGDEKTRIIEADAGLKYAYTLWVEVANDQSDILMDKNNCHFNKGRGNSETVERSST